MTKIGRNEQCLCGSGKKYKKCCYLKENQDSNSKLVPEIEKHFGDKVQIKKGDKNQSVSDAISVLVKDYLEEHSDEKEQIKIIRIAVTAWNNSVKSQPRSNKKKQKEKLENALQNLLDEEYSDEYLQMALNIVSQKKLLFPHVKRFIQFHSILTNGRGDFNLSIISCDVEDKTSLLN